jgi:hypothetical protein
VWYLLRSVIIFAVVASNIHWHWTPNGYLAGILAFVAALLALEFVGLFLIQLSGIGQLMKFGLALMAELADAGGG